MKQSADDSEKAIKGGAEGAEESIGKSSKQAQKDTKQVEKSASKVGTAFLSAGKIAGASFLAIGSAAVAVGTKAVSGAVDFDKAMNQFAASTGTSQDELADYEETLKSIYTNNYGESLKILPARWQLLNSKWAISIKPTCKR